MTDPQHKNRPRTICERIRWLWDVIRFKMRSTEKAKREAVLSILDRVEERASKVDERLKANVSAFEAKSADLMDTASSALRLLNRASSRLS